MKDEGGTQLKEAQDFVLMKHEVNDELSLKPAPQQVEYSLLPSFGVFFILQQPAVLFAIYVYGVSWIALGFCHVKEVGYCLPPPLSFFI